MVEWLACLVVMGFRIWIDCNDDGLVLGDIGKTNLESIWDSDGMGSYNCGCYFEGLIMEYRFV